MAKKRSLGDKVVFWLLIAIRGSPVCDNIKKSSQLCNYDKGVFSVLY